MDTRLEAMRQMYEEQIKEIFDAASRTTNYEHVCQDGTILREPVGCYNGRITNDVARNLISVSHIAEERKTTGKPAKAKRELKRVTALAEEVLELNAAILDRENVRRKEIKMKPFPYESLVNHLEDIKKCRHICAEDEKVSMVFKELAIRMVKMLHFAYGQDGMEEISEIKYAIDTGVYSPEQYAITPSELEQEKEALLTMLKMKSILLKTLQRMPIGEKGSRAVDSKLLESIEAISTVIRAVMQGKSKEIDKLYEKFHNGEGQNLTK